MGTIHIHSNKANDLYFLNEMARRMNLKSEIKMPKPETNVAHSAIELSSDFENVRQK